MRVNHSREVVGCTMKTMSWKSLKRSVERNGEGSAECGFTSTSVLSPTCNRMIPNLDKIIWRLSPVPVSSPPPLFSNIFLQNSCWRNYRCALLYFPWFNVTLEGFCRLEELTIQQRGEAFGCSTPAPLWPAFTHTESIWITAFFMRFGQCPIHTVWASECVFVCMCACVCVC